MCPFLDHLARQILPLFILGTSVSFAADQPVLNELNTMIEEPLVNLPEVDSTSPFRSASRKRPVAQSGQHDELIRLAEEAVDSTRRRLLSTEINSPWQMMHGLLALRRDFDVRKDGEITSGLDWISSGPSYEGEPWFEKTPYGGRAHPYSRPWAFEGHANQFLAILSMSALPLDHQFGTPQGPITIAQMVEHAQKTISSKDEPTWTLWALSRYLPPDAAWRNIQGQNWSIERLVSIQTKKPLKGTACGGTHGMFALAHARNVYQRTGKPLRGVWLEAEYKIRRQISTARVQQNGNGMLSSNYFRGREYKQDFNKRMASAGHLLEFLMIALPQDELQDRWVRRAIQATAQDLIRNRKSEVRCSPLYHAVNALNIYLDRVRPQSTQVAVKTDAEGQLQPVDEGRAGKLKSIPATSISSTKTVMTEKESTSAETADTPGSTATEAATDESKPATEADESPDECEDVAAADSQDKSETPADSAATADAEVKPTDTPATDTGWRKSTREKAKPAEAEKEAADEESEEAATDDQDSDTRPEDEAVDSDDNGSSAEEPEAADDETESDVEPATEEADGKDGTAGEESEASDEEIESDEESDAEDEDAEVPAA